MKSFGLGVVRDDMTWPAIKALAKPVEDLRKPSEATVEGLRATPKACMARRTLSARFCREFFLADIACIPQREGEASGHSPKGATSHQGLYDLTTPS